MNYFSEKEQACPCCGKICTDATFLEMMNLLREGFGKPIYVNSWCRCEKHNRAVSGKPSSSHLFGLAADIRCYSDEDRGVLLDLWFRLCEKYKKPFRVGISKNFLHFDIDEGKNYPRVWVYNY